MWASECALLCTALHLCHGIVMHGQWLASSVREMSFMASWFKLGT